MTDASQCLTDSFAVSNGAGGINPPAICGINTGEHSEEGVELAVAVAAVVAVVAATVAVAAVVAVAIVAVTVFNIVVTVAIGVTVAIIAAVAFVPFCSVLCCTARWSGIYSPVAPLSLLSVYVDVDSKGKSCNSLNFVFGSTAVGTSIPTRAFSIKVLSPNQPTTPKFI